jgi:IS1 family transposase
VFGSRLDYAQLVRLYGTAPETVSGRYCPTDCIGAVRTPRIGSPDWDHISSSYVERQNLTMRMHMRRFTRMTNAFSKKIENHAAEISLHFMSYTFVKVHSLLHVSPTMEAGVTDRLWDVSDIVALLETGQASRDLTRGPYKSDAS